MTQEHHRRGAFQWLVSAVTVIAIGTVAGCSLPGSRSSSVEIAPASILGWTPGITRDVPLTAPLSVYFTRGVDRASVERSWKLTPTARGTFTWSETSVAFTPAPGLRSGSYYHLVVGRKARDDRGKPLTNALDVAFTTGDPLQVTSVTPSDGTQGVPLNGLIAVTFNHPMVALAGLSATTPDPSGWNVSISPSTPGHGSWLGTSTWIFHPDSGLVPSSRYSVTASGSTRDAWGEAIGQDLHWSFQTAGPEVVDTSPKNGESYADPNGVVRITFNQPMDHASTANAFSLEAGGNVPGSVRWDGNTLVFTPASPFDPSRQYSAAVAPSATSANGKATLGKEFDLTFNVAQPPRIVSTTPAQGATSNPYSADFHFSAPMKQQTLDRRLTITPSLSGMGTSVYGTTYSIYGSFEPSTTYAITIDTGAQDRFGRALSTPYTLRFTTAPLSPSVGLSARPGIYSGIAFSAGQVVQLPVQVINVPHVHYTFMRITPAAALGVEGGCGGGPPSGTTLRDWLGQTPDRLNQAEHTSVRLARPDGSPLAPGVYWLSAQIPSDVPGVQSTGLTTVSELIAATNVSITAKTDGRSTLAWVTSAKTGRPLPGVIVRLLDNNGAVFASGQTDARGLFLFHRVVNSRWAVAVDGGGYFGMAFDDWAAQTPRAGNFYPMAQYQQPPNGAYAYTDRPIYRPGQRVYFRAVLWRDRDAWYSLYGTKMVQVQASGSSTNGGGQPQPLYAAKLPLDRFGSVHGTFRLPAKAATGSAEVTFAVGPQQYTSASFSIAEYRKPEFLVRASTGRPSYVQGQTIDATVQVKYVFGAPVMGQQVSWHAYSQDRFIQPPGWEDYSFGDQDAIAQQAQMGMLGNVGAGGTFGNEVAHGEGTTDEAGRLSLQVPVDLASKVLDQTITIEATVTDVNHQSISARAQVTAHRAAFSVGLRPDRQVVASGQQETVDIAAVKDDGSAVAHVPLMATIYQRTYTSVLSNLYGPAGFWQQVPHDRLLTSQRIATDERGRGRVTFTPKDGGIYYVVVEGRDATGKIARSGLFVYASAAGFSDFGQSSNTTISLKPDKSSYQVGETAHVLVAAPFDRATALVTLERGSVREVRVQRLQSNSSTVSIPMTLADLPNVYVTVTLYRGWRNGSPPDWRYGVANLHVKVDPRRLLVHLSQDRSRYHPGDSATYTVKTTDVHGHPASAEVSLALVDTAVLALQDESNADILQALYGERPLSVGTISDGVASFDHVQPGQAGGAGPRCGLGGGGGGPGLSAPLASGLAQTLPPGVKLRHRFADTAYWTATLVTDNTGTANVDLQLPDNLTTWRLDARGITADQRVGQRTLMTLTTQDIILRPVTPRFFLQGDSLKIGAVVNNNLSRAVTAAVSAAAAGLAVTGRSSITVTVPAHGERLVLWQAEVPSAGSAQLTFRATPSTGGVQGDAVRVVLPVHLPLTDETVGAAGQVFQSIRQLVVVPPDAQSRPGALTVEVSSSLTAGMGSAYRIFKPTPYDSNEDIAERVLAAAALRSLPASLTGLLPRTYASLTPAIDDGASKLIANQLPDGGWPWYNSASAQSDPVITANVVEALSDSKAGGRLVSRALGNGRRYLRRTLRDVSTGERIHILSVLARSGMVDSAAMNSIYGDTVQRAHLDPAPLADLARGMDLAAAHKAARSLVSLLDSRSMASATGAHWEGSGLETGQSAVATTTAVLATLVRLEPSDPLVPAAARWLMLARQGDVWDCPPDTAQALAALAAYARAAHEGKADYRYQVMVDNRQTLAGQYTSDSAHKATSVDVPVSALHRGKPSALLIRRETANGTMGTGPLYYVAHLQYFLPAASIQPRTQGVAISRRYLTVAGRPIDSLAVGSVVKVELTVRTGQTLEYLHVDDPIPAGFEPIDQSLKTSQQGLFPSQRPFIYGSPADLTAYLTHTDLRDDRVSLYAISLPPGAYTYTYLAQTTTAGRYGVAPSHAAELFFPEVFGRSAGQVFTVT